MHQLELFNKYTYDMRDRFNKDLLERKDEDLIDDLLKVIIKCQTYRYFTIHMKSYRVVDNPIEIQDLLYKYRQNQIDKRKSKKKEENEYSYIQYKESHVKLLIIVYYIEVKKTDQETGEVNIESREEEVYIVFPRVVNKYYYKIFGNMCVPMHQIVDASTYNNSGTKSKKHSVTLKTMFMPIRIYRNNIKIQDINGDNIEATLYSSLIFNNNVNVVKYILARFGLYDGLDFLGVRHIYVLNHNPKDSNMYTFEKNGIYVSAPKYIYDKDSLTQSTVATIIKSINKNTTPLEIHKNDFWLSSLGQDYGGFSKENGSSVLYSIESIYDYNTYEALDLPVEDKLTSYHLLRWMIREFSNLKIKNNLELSTKRIRTSEYIAALYGMKLIKGISRISNYGMKMELNDIKKAIVTDPMYIMNQINKNGTLISYRNNVNDNDCTLALKFTYKGLSGMGEKSKSTISDVVRSTNPSELGFLDQDTSSNSDPGLSGILCPYAKIKNNKFYNIPEPNTWKEEYEEIIREYRKLRSAKEILSFKKSLGIKVDMNQDQKIDQCIDIVSKLIEPIIFIQKKPEVLPLEFNEEE